jgi:hypothetical protein
MKICLELMKFGEILKRPWEFTLVEDKLIS